MTCEDLQELLFEDPLAEGLEAHLQQCAACRALQQDLLAMSGALAEQPRHVLPEGFELSLRRRLTAEATHLRPAASASAILPLAERTSSKWGTKAALLAMAAAMILMVGGTILWKKSTIDHQAPLLQHYKLQLTVNTTAVHPEARFQLELPQGVRPYPGLAALMGPGATLRWVSALQSGLNQIAIPLITQSDTPARVRARLTVGGRTLTTEVELTRSAQTLRRGDHGELVTIAWVIDQETLSTRPRERLP